MKKIPVWPLAFTFTTALGCGDKEPTAPAAEGSNEAEPGPSASNAPDTSGARSSTASRANSGVEIPSAGLEVDREREAGSTPAASEGEAGGAPASGAGEAGSTPASSGADVPVFDLSSLGDADAVPTSGAGEASAAPATSDGDIAVLELAGEVAPASSDSEASTAPASSDSEASTAPASSDSEAGAAPAGTGGACCPDGDCLCHGPAPTGVTASDGPFKTTDYRGNTGTIYYPTDAEPPLAGVAVCGGFTNSGPEMEDWGPFYASWGIVTVITRTGPLDFPGTRADALLESISELKTENTTSGSPLFGKMGDRYGISGYSMGGGGTTIGCNMDPTLRTGVGLAPWAPESGMTVPTLFLCGDSDAVAGVSEPKTAAGTPSLQVVIDGYTHFAWFGPTDISAHYALAWQKVYLEGDTRWESLLREQVAGVASMQSSGF